MDTPQTTLQNPRIYARVILQAAEQGDPDAQATLGQLLLDGRGIGQDAQLALIWFRIAARSGHAMAINMVGRCLEHGWGCEVDLTSAAQHYRQASQLGLDWGHYNYGQLLTRGRGVEQNLPQAYALFRRAAEQGHAKSMNLLGRFFHEGVVVERSVTEAERWYRLAAEGGDFRGQYYHAAALAEQGDEDGACYWLERALETATDGFLQSAYPVLLTSRSARISEIGQRYRHAVKERLPDSTTQAVA